ncbi:cobalt-precorrin-6A reductase [Microcoleus sp. FACHB-1515]|uniref:cobalt-precorrin-6A reductase n=1 Tax=Cyanophyceae TaxID=3028117 RepID=UPI001688109D|nr:cobalt-precorrin-6A reductase [Microcoleus sp. FACHB-1515]MBD2088554.1 cobalt-precorrin-6A reductase [Microcoleus sp. FACHB-1515]
MCDRRIWLIGGTQESAQIARACVDQSIPCIVTVTTESARSLYPPMPIRVGKLTPADLKMFLREHFIFAIVDASHPFAIEISQLAIAIAAELKLPYLRFERSNVVGEPSLNFFSFAALLETDLLIGERVLLTVGYRSLPQFAQWHDRAVLFARILPSIEALSAAQAAGFTSDRLIALRPPISAELEAALWRQWQISIVVTKASGTAGGEAVKRQVAAELGVRLVTIDRPSLSYPQQTSNLMEVMRFCQAKLRQ